MHVFRPYLARPASFFWKPLVAIAGAFVTTVPPQLNGATINARSPAFADVETAITLANDGDTVIVPAGTANWSSMLSITKGITLQGQTTITGAGTSTPIVNDKTIIKNDVISKSNLLSVSITAAQSFRLTGFTFQANLSKGTQVNLAGNGGSAPVMNMRVDHCHFAGFTDRGIWTGGWLYGVADHNYMQAAGNGQCFFINMASYGGKLLGHGAWADYPWFGTNKFFFIEDNTMVGTGGVTTSGATDSENGARYVIRHNDFTNCRPGGHGTEGENRGTRATETYNNAYHWTIQPSANIRSGTSLYHDNTWTGVPQQSASHQRIDVFREFGGVGKDCPYGYADGTGKFDQNDTEGDGTFVDGHAPHVYSSGTVTSVGSGIFTDSSKSWTPNQWVGYSVKQTNSAEPSYPKSTYIVSNTSNTINYNSRYGSTDRGPILSFAAGDTYQIHKVLSPLDQIGRGKGDLLTGNKISGVTNTVAGHTWAHQALEPAMSWNNVDAQGIAYGFTTGFPTEVQGRDYCDLGKGLSTNGAPSQVTTIYKAALNGVDYTGPYTYPHPLTIAPLPPSNLTVLP